MPLLVPLNTNKQPLLLLGLDEIAKTEDEIGTSYYRALATLFVRLRNNLNSVLFVYLSIHNFSASFHHFIIFEHPAGFAYKDTYLFCTFYKTLDINPHKELEFENRPIPFVEDKLGKPMEEVF